MLGTLRKREPLQAQTSTRPIQNRIPRDAAPGSEPIESLFLVCAANEFPRIEKEFVQAIAQIDSWPDSIREAVGEKNRKALVRALAEDLPNNQ